MKTRLTISSFVILGIGLCAAALFDEFNRWFAGLWQGRALAITIAWISIFVSAGVFLFAYFLPSDPESHSRSEDERNRSVD